LRGGKETEVPQVSIEGEKKLPPNPGRGGGLKLGPGTSEGKAKSGRKNENPDGEDEEKNSP